MAQNKERKRRREKNDPWGKNEKTLEKIKRSDEKKNGRSTSHIREGGGGSITRNKKERKNTKKGGCKKKEKEKWDARRLVYSL